MSEITKGISLLLVFLTFLSVAINSICFLSNPILIIPSIKAIVAGVAFFSLIVFSSSSAICTLNGYASPCAIIVDSRATIGFFSSIAFWT